MSIASTIFAKIRAKQEERSRPFRGEYLDFVRALAMGQEVDDDELSIICTELKIDEARLQYDIDVMSKRFQAVEQIRQADEAAAELPTLQAEQHRLFAERQQVLNEYEQKLVAIHEKIRHLERVDADRVAGTSYLSQNPLNIELIRRQNEIHQQQLDLLPAYREIESELRNYKNPHIASYTSAKQEVSYYEQKRKLSDGDRVALRKAQEIVAENQPYVESLQQQLDELKAQFRELDRQQAEIEREKLKP